MKKQLQKNLSAFGVMLMMFSASSYAQIAPALATQLQQILNNRVQNNGDRGVSACVIMPNGSTWKGTAGVGQNSVAITDTTVFHGASITKINIATLILLLAENNLLHLDSSWKKYINLNATFNPSITIRQLLNHTSGIKDYLEAPGSGTFVTNNFNYTFTPVQILENIVNGTPDFAPGTNFNYSTSNYVLLALIAQTVTGNPVQQELRTRIWNPLGMSHTYFGGYETYTEPRAGVWWNFGAGFQNYSNNPETSMLTFGYGGANIVSTPQDLALFARALFTGTLLSQTSKSAMLVFSPNSYPTWCAGYGLGVHHALAFQTNTVLGHDGYYTNMSDMFHTYDYGFTLVTMTNSQTQWSAIFDQMYNAIRNHLMVGIMENTATLNLNLFPNPVTNNLTINLGSPNKNVELNIIDITGKIIYTVTINEAQKFEVNTKDFTAGIYAVQVKTENFTVTKKLIVTK